MTPLTMVSLGGSNYSGTVVTYTLQALSAGTLDFTGRTIWADVSGITRTEKLIITNNPQVGYVWTCVDSEGMGEWQYNGTGSTSTIWTAGTGIKSAVLGGSDGDAGGDYAVSEGYDTTASGPYSHAEGYQTTASWSGSHAEGYQTTASWSGSHAEGWGTTSSNIATHSGGYNCVASGIHSFVHGENSNATNDNTIVFGKNITGTSINTVYTPNLIINTGGTSSILGINTNNPNYTIDAYGDTDSRFYYNGASSNGGSLSLSATTGLPLFGVVAGTANAPYQTSSVGIGVRAWDDLTYTVYGYQGDAFVYAGIYTNGLNIISNDGSTLGTGADYIRFYAGQSTGGGAGNNPDLHIQGSGSSRGYVGINIPSNQDPSERLDVNGNGRFRNIGSSASSGALHYASDGSLTTNTSDKRLKTNINPLTNALDKVKGLRGVTYNWVENPTGDTRIGFIAQEVNNVVPELVFVNPNSQNNYMGVHYDNVTALLVEAIKELSSGVIRPDITYLETQTILAEDNNIDLNYSGTPESAIGGGIRVLHALGVDSAAEFITDSDGNFITNNDFKPNSLTIPFYTPISSEDINGNIGNITRDGEYLYIKCQDGWRRSNLERF